MTQIQDTAFTNREPYGIVKIKYTDGKNVNNLILEVGKTTFDTLMKKMDQSSIPCAEKKEVKPFSRKRGRSVKNSRGKKSSKSFNKSKKARRSSSSKKLDNIRCSACGQDGHRKNQRICPVHPQHIKKVKQEKKVARRFKFENPNEDVVSSSDLEIEDFDDEAKKLHKKKPSSRVDTSSLAFYLKKIHIEAATLGQKIRDLKARSQFLQSQSKENREKYEKQLVEYMELSETMLSMQMSDNEINELQLMKTQQQVRSSDSKDQDQDHTSLQQQFEDWQKIYEKQTSKYKIFLDKEKKLSKSIKTLTKAVQNAEREREKIMEEIEEKERDLANYHKSMKIEVA